MALENGMRAKRHTQARWNRAQYLKLSRQARRHLRAGNIQEAQIATNVASQFRKESGKPKPAHSFWIQR